MMESTSATNDKKKRDFATMSANEKNTPHNQQKKPNVSKNISALLAQEEIIQALLPTSRRATISTVAQNNNETNSEPCNEKKLARYLKESRSSLKSSHSKGKDLTEANLERNEIKEDIINRTNATNNQIEGERERDILETNSNVDASVSKGFQQTMVSDDIDSRMKTLKGSYRRCVCCGTLATVWCYECGQCLCTNCDNERHDTIALDALRRPLCSHRVEYIISGDCGLPILSPILELIVIVGAFEFIRRTLWAHAESMLTVDYFFESVCPQVQTFRKIVFRLDHALYPLLKGQLGEWCDTEDAFLKIFTDLWVRGILTHTDSFALLVMKVKSMIAALMIVLLVIAPLLAIPYAIVATLVRFVEITIFPNKWTVVRIFAKLIRGLVLLIWLPCRIFGLCCKSTLFGCILMDGSDYYRVHYPMKIPPKTGHRKRPTSSHGISDSSVWGIFSRILRVFKYFYTKAHRTILGAVVTSVFFALICRILLLSLPRCGSGLLWSTYFYGEQELLDSITEQNEPKKCFSIDDLARKLSERMGIQLPDLNSLGEEGRMLQRMQDSTENDVLDDTLQRICIGLMRHIFEAYPRLSSVIIFAIFFGLAFAGLIRRFMFWLDLQHREKYRTLRFEKVRSRQTTVSP